MAGSPFPTTHNRKPTMKTIIAVSGMAGVGKTTVCNLLVKHFAGRYLTALTTRPPRSTDAPGEYRHLSEAEFLRLRNAGRLISSFRLGESWYANPAYPFIETSLSDTIRVRPSKPEVIEFWNGIFPEKIAFVHLLAPSDRSILRKRILLRQGNPDAFRRRLSEERDMDAEIGRLIRKGLPIHAVPFSENTTDAFYETIGIMRRRT